MKRVASQEQYKKFMEQAQQGEKSLMDVVKSIIDASEGSVYSRVSFEFGGWIAETYKDSPNSKEKYREGRGVLDKELGTKLHLTKYVYSNCPTGVLDMDECYKHVLDKLKEEVLKEVS